MSTTEFLPGTETCTAVIHCESETGEAYLGPIAFGYYTADEIWIESEGHRVQIPMRHLKDFIKQVKRTERIALESEQLK